MTVSSLLFVVLSASATSLVLLFLGYPVLLWLARRPSPPSVAGEPADVAVVIPTLNEEEHLPGKLRDIGLSRYPPERLHIIVADGGSTDRTRALVADAAAAGAPVRLLDVPGASSKAAQVNCALREVREAFIVFTDADARLEPDCIGRLVDLVRADPRTAVAAARVSPDGGLLEERIHWEALNWLWWLEGEALDCAGVSGVCYAVRREAVAPLAEDAAAEDAHLALAAAARGWRIRLCRDAHARELRVPRTGRELLEFRRRRGTVLLAELLRWNTAAAGAGARWRFARAMRILTFRGLGPVCALAAVSAASLLATPLWPEAALTAAGLFGPMVAAPLVSGSLRRAAGSPWRLVAAAARYGILTSYALLRFALPRVDAPQKGTLPCSEPGT